MNKIMYILNYPGDGGTEKYVMSLMSALGKDRCVFVYSEPGPFLEKFKEIGAPMYQVSMRGPFDFQAAKKVKEITIREKVSHIHAQFLRENYIALLAAILGAKVRVIWTYHFNLPMPAALKFINTFLIRLNYRVISVANFIKQEIIKKGIPESKITVIYNGVRDPAINPDRKEPANGKVISVIGRLSEEKGHKFLFKSLAKLKSENPQLEWRLDIAGDGPLRHELLNLAKELDILENMNFLGFVNNMDNVYINSDVVVMPSENEAFPFVAIEALAFEKPVIATNVGGLPEVIKNNETGLLVSYGDVDALADSIKTLLADKELANTLAQTGRAFFLQNLTFDKMLQQTLAIYDMDIQELTNN